MLSLSILRRWKIGFFRWLQLCLENEEVYGYAILYRGRKGHLAICVNYAIRNNTTIPKKDSQYCFSASVLFSRSIDSWDFYLCISDFRNPPPNIICYLSHSLQNQAKEPRCTNLVSVSALSPWLVQLVQFDETPWG